MNKILWIIFIVLEIALFSFIFTQGIKKTKTVDFEKNTSELIYSGLITSNDTNVLWTTRTLTLVFKNRILEVNIGLRSDGTFVWKEAIKESNWNYR